MKKIPVFYSATGQREKVAKWVVISLAAVTLLYILSLAYWLSEGLSPGIRMAAIVFQTALISIIFTFKRPPSILINAKSNTIVYYSGRKRFIIRPGDIKAAQFSGRILEITAKKKRRIEIHSESFPKVDMQGLAYYIESLMGEERRIWNDFFDNRDSGFHVAKKTVMESANPWPRVFFIFLVFFTVIMIIYWLVDILFT